MAAWRGILRMVKGFSWTEEEGREKARQIGTDHSATGGLIAEVYKLPQSFWGRKEVVEATWP